MVLLGHHSPRRPGPTARLDLQHPMARGLIFCLPMLPGMDPTWDAVKGYRGTLSGPPVRIGGDIRHGLGSGLDFSTGGTGGRAVWSHHTSLTPTSAITVLVIVRITTATGWGNILGKPAGAAHSDPYYDWAILHSGDAARTIAMRVEDSYASGPVSALGTATGLVKHAAFAWDKDQNSGNPYIYIEGTEVSSYVNRVAKTTSITDGNQDVRAGVAVNNTSDEFSGHLLGAWVYNRRFTQSELVVHVSSPWAMFWERRRMFSVPAAAPATSDLLLGHLALSGVGR